jgi:hypothetical protein
VVIFIGGISDQNELVNFECLHQILARIAYFSGLKPVS